MKKYLLALVVATIAISANSAPLSVSQVPLFLGATVPPLNLLVMSKDHKIYYEAYNDYSDLNSDGIPDIGYKGYLAKSSGGIDYYGYFDSYKCYSYSGGQFNPASTTADKTCSGTWSGDFLNYLTTSRIDALRKVLYGGKRYTDSTSATILERSYIPQDAHSWGKEYTSVAYDGYDISNYTPLALPPAGKRHLFANTTPSGTTSPLLRVLTNSSYRIWEWVSIERPVAGTECATGNNSRATCAQAGGTVWEVVPESALSSLTITTYDIGDRADPIATNDTIGAGPGSALASHPGNLTAMNAMEATYGVVSERFGSGAELDISCSHTAGDTDANHPKCNPFKPYPTSSADSQQNYYMTIIEGSITVPSSDTYTFAVDGDDAIDVFIDGTKVADYYGGHGFCNCTTHSGSIYLTAGSHTIKFRHEEMTGGDGYRLSWQKNITASVLTDYTLRTKVCDASVGLESNCRAYGTTPTYKPIGLLQEYGENNKMWFGLLSGSYDHNLAGGVLRRNIANISNEIDLTTGQFTNVSGLIKTLNNLSIIQFRTDYSYEPGWSGAWITTRPINDGEQPNWGNPIGEMMYEGLRYFAGKTSPTTAYSGSMTRDTALGLPLPGWANPYDKAAGGAEWCAKPFMMVISDINVSYDSDLPGSAFNSISTDLTGLNVSTLGDTLWTNEGLGTQNVFIGEVAGSTTGVGDPSPKSVSSFGNIRGLAPEEPTKQGTYYAASVANYGRTQLLGNTLQAYPAGTPSYKVPKVENISVALASPLPRVEIPVSSTQKITLVPFAKSVSGCLITSATFKPTNQIVDFYIDTIRNVTGYPTDATVNSGRPYYKFRINFEDVEQGADHDMDAIALYEVLLNADNTLTVKLNSNYAAGCIVQHMGFVISGTTADGTYLMVRDSDTSTGTDVVYPLDCRFATPYDPAFPNVIPDPANCLRATGTGDLPLVNAAKFTPGTDTSAMLLKDPLWYAAKWGGFIDTNPTDPLVPGFDATKLDALDSVAEWTTGANGVGVPDSYFLVTNPLNLYNQLKKAFSKIDASPRSAASVATNSTSMRTETHIYQAKFESTYWSGELLSYSLGYDGTIGSEDWNAATNLRGSSLVPSGRKIFTYKPSTSAGVEFKTLADLDASQITALKTNPATSVVESDARGQARIDYIRGSNTDEGSAATSFRVRPEDDLELSIGGKTVYIRHSKLGDIVNSNPLYVGTPFAGDYPTGRVQGVYTSDSSYRSVFYAASHARTPAVYVGSNDGLMHGFNATFHNPPLASDGQELFAFIPSKVLPNLNKLTSQSYNGSHQYFTDGSPWAADVNLGDSTTPDWRTVLVAGLNGGGKEVYALDVTDPSAFAADKVLWEFTSSDDSDLGYTYGQPIVKKMNNGKWAAIFGNGYNSTGETAKLFIKFIDGSGVVKLATNSTTGNGLSSPNAIDVNGDGMVDYIYAGDLQGNLWKFDVSSATTASWGNPLTGGVPLYVAKDASTPTPKRQPITSRPELTFHPVDWNTVLVMFGTGKYIEACDKTNDCSVNQPAKWSLYGVWDKNVAGAAVSGRSDLLQQTITSTTTISDVDYRLVSTNKMNWRMAVPSTDPLNPDYLGWYIDLTGTGERTTGNPQLYTGVLYVNTLIPNTDACSAGADGYWMAFDYSSGGLPIMPTFDTNKDKLFNKDDTVVAGVSIGAAIGGTTIIPPMAGGGPAVGVASTTDGALKTVRINTNLRAGRISWKELFRN